jgi:hypothetical protein
LAAVISRLSVVPETIKTLFRLEIVAAVPNKEPSHASSIRGSFRRIALEAGGIVVIPVNTSHRFARDLSDDLT